ncbi:MAG: hypothetical protein A2268_07840 [Candidatus Raymondbacteria bacterium RifOxyA12_full_50_37]|uniref:ABC transmembrane type-1 domain-containing protein n=1 Tax=Candidatus Raymondbacteria bacterium RIFOXYD12_FULL_49_13 TaxID=1817890 RepID=A0A1F7F7K3_UNCRA|nr:MAG: hypothetical protein A2268_07840 [Candidatus Raymondbacteria bacterium RifOxyA12_full_50_37]OGJ89617.1 MAG: hypothetical protein A2248_09560 [Candidatus Raymondbacteria bacterium RIFOXYA2_FULL_49_16]OGK02574.1 MAG: hypothetical protein A2350_09990 [Candidatus Raymondbacteria bacterium RifOxyB12_full_50_8]OGK02635.1 MAG: hypothetical protein A2519_11275 [Candidatus Raymondbacteria bacterium RIFOXYD12_FULL_49_13]OGP42873.1 MAG: hypothetical protein A2324_01975 [Candidatus Raymondbacteria 
MTHFKSVVAKHALSPARVIILLGGAALVCCPFWWMIISSFDNGINQAGLPMPPSLWFNIERFGVFNYLNAAANIPIFRYYLNTVCVTIAIIALQVSTCCMAGYAFGKGKFTGKNKIFLVFLATMMIPFQLYMIPLYLMMNKIGLVNTYWALILPSMQSAYGVFLCTQYMKTLPDSLLESARMDGASEFRIFFTIIMPLCKPVLATLTVLIALGTWNDFLWPYLVLLNQDMYTITLGVSMFQQQSGIAIGNIVAVSIMAIFPIIVLYLFLQKFIISGITMGANKY